MYPPVAPLSYLNAASDRALLEDISAAVSRMPMSPEVSVAGTAAASKFVCGVRDVAVVNVSAAVRSVEHPDDFNEPCIYCERCGCGFLSIWKSKSDLRARTLTLL